MVWLKIPRPSPCSYTHKPRILTQYIHTYNKVNTVIQYATEHLSLTQLGMKVGIKIWGQQGVDAIIK